MVLFFKICIRDLINFYSFVTTESENFIKSIEEIKSFFSFKFFFINHNEKNIEKKDFDAIIIESDFGNKIPLNKIKAPKILIKKRDKKTKLKIQSQLAYKYFSL